MGNRSNRTGSGGALLPSRRSLLGLSGMVLAGALATGGGLAQSTPQAPVAGLPEGPGREVFAQTCSQCHELSVATSEGRTSAGWSDIIESMIGMGAPIDAAKAKTIHDYLSAHFAPATAVPQATPAPAPVAPR